MEATHQETQSELYNIEEKKWRPASDVWWSPPKKYTRAKRERRVGGNKHRIAVQTPRKISRDAVQAPAHGEEKWRLKCNVLWSAEKCWKRRNNVRQQPMKCHANSKTQKKKMKHCKTCYIKHSKRMQTKNNCKRHRKKCNMFSTTLRRKILNYEYFTTKQRAKTRKLRKGNNNWRKYAQKCSLKFK